MGLPAAGWEVVAELKAMATGSKLLAEPRWSLSEVGQECRCPPVPLGPLGAWDVNTESAKGHGGGPGGSRVTWKESRG